MKHLLYPAVAVLLLTGSAFTFLTAQNWQIADGYNIAFSIDDAGGIFKGFKGAISFDENNPATAKFDVSIDVATVNTGNALQNKHLKSEEWLDATKYPTIHFVSTRFTKTGAGYQVAGNLQLHGVTKPIIIPFTFIHTGSTGKFTGTFTVNRSDYQIGKPGGDTSEPIKIDISVPVK